MSDKRLLITGASGYLGHRLVPMASEFAEILAVSRKPVAGAQTDVTWLQVDLTCDLLSLFERYRPDAVIHAAAINPGVNDHQFPNNETMAARVAMAAAAAEARLVVVSSDMVHGGSCLPYADDAQPSPSNAYGLSKASAERVALAHHSNVVCVRTSLIYGLERVDRGTASFIARLERGERQTVFDNVYRQPVWVDALADGLIKLALDLDVVGTLNLAGGELISRAAFAKAMLAYWGYALDHVDEGPAPEGHGIPLKLALTLDLASQLGMATPGVTDTIAQSVSGQQ